mgnify:CR=1 FL=1
MEIQILPLIIVVAYLVGMLTVGAVVSKVQIKNAKDYMVAGRRMGLFMVAFSLSANNIGGGCTTGLAQKAFGDWGLSAVWYVLAASIAMIPLAYFAPKIRKTMAVTIPEVVGRRFGKFSSNFTAILSVLSLFCLTSSQSPECVPDLRGHRHHSVHHHGRHDRRPDLRPGAVRHHPGGPGHRHSHRAEPCRRLERHLCGSAR